MATIDDCTAAGLARWVKAFEAVKVAVGKQRRVQGTIACPNCPGRIAYSVAQNGHTWGRCSTDGCAKWIE